mgnify:CR=1 FL=1
MLARRKLDAIMEIERLQWVFPPPIKAVDCVSSGELLALLSEACRQSAIINGRLGNDVRVEVLERSADDIEKLANRHQPDLSPCEDTDELLRDHLTQSMHLKTATRGPHLRYGLGLLNLTVLVSLMRGSATADVNHALTDCLKTFRIGPVLSVIHQHADAIAKHFNDELQSWL